jgi:hypothetical protein
MDPKYREPTPEPEITENKFIDQPGPEFVTTSTEMPTRIPPNQELPVVDENKIVAQIFKAERKGDLETVKKLKEQLEDIRNAKSSQEEGDKLVKVIPLGTFILLFFISLDNL